jgi:hypothetical protein
VLNFGRSAGICVIATATETGWAAGRSQAGIVFIGATSGLEFAKAGAALLGHSGRAWYDTTAGILPHQWILGEAQPGSHGPVLAGP